MGGRVKRINKPLVRWWREVRDRKSLEKERRWNATDRPAVLDFVIGEDKTTA